MDPPHQHQDGPYDTALVSELLKSKRKSRGIKSCFPCRHRKVRCDGGIPCSNCVRRDHASLCRTLVSSPTTASASSTMSAQSPRPSAPSIDLLMNPIISESSDAQQQQQHQQYRTDRYYGAVTGYPGNISTNIPQRDAGIQQQAITGLQPAITQGLNSHQPQVQAIFFPSSGGEQTSQDVQSTIKRLEEIQQQISSLKADLLGRPDNNPDGIPSASAGFPISSERTSQNPPNNTSLRLWGKRFIEGASGAVIFLGSRADPPATLGCHGAELQASEEGFSLNLNVMMPEQLAPRTYPFTNLWTPEASLPDVCRTLPDNSEIIRYWQAFETYVYPFYPALVALEEFRSSMFMFLGRRSTAGGSIGASSAAPSFIDTTDPSWLALLFAVLACGAHFSDDAAKERDLRSKVFICSSFQCLRTANLFHKTDVYQIQAMALLGHCLRNNLETNSAWIFMGTTLRLAQSIGLHETASMPAGNQMDASELRRMQSKHLWWILVWQDTLLSVTYDRPTTSFFTTSAWTVPYTACNQNAPNNSHKRNGFSFAEAIFHVCQIILDRSREEQLVRQGSATGKTAEILEQAKRRLQLAVEEAAPFLRDEAYCRTLQEHLERLALQIHVAYASCSIYRLSLDSIYGDPAAPGQPVTPRQQHTPASTEALIKEYISHASKGVCSFLDMYRLSPNVCRSWAFVHNAVSGAITAKRFLPPGPSMQQSNTNPAATSSNSAPSYRRQPPTNNHGIPSLLNSNPNSNSSSPNGNGSSDNTPSMSMPAANNNSHGGNSPAPHNNSSSISISDFEALVRQLISVLEREEKQSEWRDADTNVRYFGPYSRALRALKEAYQYHDSRGGT